MNNITNACTVVQEKEYRELLLVLSIGGMVGSLVCLLPLILVWRFKLYKHFTHRLASYQVLSSLFFSVICALEIVFLNYYKNREVYKPLCEAVGFLFEYAVWLKLLLFMMWLTLHLFCFTIFHKNSKKQEVWIIICLMLLPFLYIWVPFVNGMYGLAGAWCWIKNRNDSCGGDKLIVGEIEQYALLYAPLFSILSVATVLLGMVMLFIVCRFSKWHRALLHDEMLLVEDRQRKKAL